MKNLLLQGAQVNTLDHEGNTPLHICAIFSNNAALDYLIKNTSIDIFVRNSKGETAMSIA